MNKVAIYCRLSDEDRNKANSNDDSESIQNQKTLLTRYVIDKGWEIYKIYSDDDYSGLDSDRPEFNQMLSDARNGNFNIVLCKSQSRFTRDMGVVEDLIHVKFLEWGIRFISVTDNADTSEKSNKKSRQINGLVNEWYCEDISEAIKASFKVKTESGKFIGSFAAYGYLKDPNDKNRLIVDEEAAEIVRLIYSWYLEGYGTQNIAYILNQRLIPNPTKYKQLKGLNYINSSQKDNYGFWNKTTVKRILKNEMYIGHMLQGKRKKVSYKSKKIVATQPSTWVRVKNTHQPIVDTTTFYAVQNRINSRVRSCGLGKAHLFASKVKCMDCHSSMNKVTASNDCAYLRCKTYAVDPNKKLCTSHSMRLDQLEEILSDKIRDSFKQYCDTDNVAYKLQKQENTDARLNLIESKLGEINKELSNKSLIIKNLYIDKVNGIISEKQFYELNKTFLHEKEILEKEREKLDREIKQLDEKSNNIKKWINVVKKYSNFEKLTNVMVNELIDYIEIGEKNKSTSDRHIKIHWLF